jgi:SsrA-binding protein
MKHNTNIVNKKAKFEFSFIRTEISGIQLSGSEVKSIRLGKVSLVDSFCFFNENELFVKNINVNNDGSAFTHIPVRDRKLLLKKRELTKLKNDLIDGLTIIPYRLFVNDRGMIKVEIALAKGKKLYDKRETIKKRDIEREIKKFL